MLLMLHFDSLEVLLLKSRILPLTVNPTWFDPTEGKQFFKVFHLTFSSDTQRNLEVVRFFFITTKIAGQTEMHQYFLNHLTAEVIGKTTALRFGDGNTPEIHSN